jgi:hypothetical protein
MFSIYSAAYNLDILRFYNDWYGGKYILITFIRVLFGSIILVSIPYSFD